MGDALHSRLQIRFLAQLLSIAACLNCLQPVAAQQNVILRIFDYKSAKPMAKLHLAIVAFNGDLSQGRAATSTIVMRTSTKTDENGTVVVTIPEPLPEHARVSSFDLFESIPDFSPAEVLKSGIVVQYGRANQVQKRKVSARPGEVLIFDKRVRSGDRVLQEMP